MLNSFDELDLTRRTRIDALCREYEDAWYNDTEPNVSAFVERVPPEDIDDCLRELLATDFELRLAEKRDIPLEMLLNQFPTHADLIERVYFEVLDEALSAPTPSSDSKVGSQIGDFQLLRELGRGGMGIVYEALQTSLQRHVALKVLPPSGQQDPARIARFSREARAIARLHHEHIVEVYGAGEADGTHFIAMQFVSGESLDRLLAKADRRREFCESTFGSTKILHATSSQSNSGSPRLGTPWREVRGEGQDRSEQNPSPPAPLPGVPGRGEKSSASSGSQRADTEINFAPEFGATQHERYRNVARIGQQMAEALSYAHSQGVLHRDVKPSNILLDDRGGAWLTDFGLAKVAESNSALTESGNIVGTIKYLAPESFNGRTDHRSDVYSLGLTLYELLTGRAAFDAPDRAELLNAILTREAASLSQLLPTAPRDLVTIIHKSIEREPAQRYQTANELADDLQRFLNDEPIRARPISNAERFGRWARRNKLLSFLLLTTFALLSVGLIGSVIANVYLKKLEGEQRQLAAEKGKLADEKTRLADEKGQLAEHNAALAERNGKLAREAQAERDRSTLLLADNFSRQGLAASEAGRDREAITLFAGAARTAHPVSADEYRRNVQLMTALTRDMGRLEVSGSLAGHPPHRFRFHPDSRSALMRDRFTGHVKRFETHGHDFRPVDWPSALGTVRGAEWSADGSRVFIAADRGVHSWRYPQLDDQQLIAGAFEQGRFVEHVGRDEKGKWLALTSGSQLRVWNLQEQRFATGLIPHSQSIVDMAFSHNGEWLICVGSDHEFRLYETKAFASPDVIPQPACVGTHRSNLGHGIVTPVFLRGDTALLTQSQGNVLDLRELIALDRHVPLPHWIGEAIVFEPVGDDQVFVGGGGGGFILKALQNQRPMIDPKHQLRQSIMTATYLPARDELFVGYASDDSERWELPSWRRLSTQFVSGGGVHVSARSPDSSRLLTVGPGEMTARVWSLPSKERSPQRVSFGTTATSQKTVAAFSADSTRLAVFEGIKHIGVFDLTTRCRIDAFDDKSLLGMGEPLDLHCVPGTSRVLIVTRIAADECVLRVRDWTDRSVVQDVRVSIPPNFNSNTRLWRSDDGTRLVLPSENTPHAVLIDIENGTVRGELLHQAKAQSWVGLSPDGQWLAFTDSQSQTSIVPTSKASQPTAAPYWKHDFIVNSAAFSRDGRWVATSSQDRFVLVVDKDALAKQRGEITPRLRLEHPASVYVSEFSADGDYLLTVCRDIKVRVWDLKTGQVLNTPISGDEDIFGVFRPGHDELLTGTFLGELNVWNSRSGRRVLPAQQLSRQRGHFFNHVRSLIVSRDGRYTAVTSPNEFFVCDLSPLDETETISLDDLQLNAEVLSGLRMLDNGATITLTPGEWQERAARYLQRSSR